MAQTKEGARKVSAAKAGITLEKYLRLVAKGLKWCSRGKHWKRRGLYCSDSSRADGLASSCNECRRQLYRETYVPHPAARHGPLPHPPRSGDKIQARQRVNVLVRTGKIPRPNDLPCADCGHVWVKGERRHEYDHYLGYDAAHHYDVQVVCSKCHARRDNENSQKTSCVHGHEFTIENTILAKNGTRHCRKCRKLYDRKRGRDAAFWRRYRAERKTRKEVSN